MVAGATDPVKARREGEGAGHDPADAAADTAAGAPGTDPAPEIRVEELAPCRQRVTVTFAATQVRAAVDAEFDELNAKVAFPGFRPGKAPRRLIEARFGKAIRDDVRGKLVEDGFRAAVLCKHVAPLGRPTLTGDDVLPAADAAFTFQFEVTTRPSFELPAWSGLEVKVPAVSVTDADVEQGIEAMRARGGSLVASDEPLLPDDVAVVSWTALVDGVEVEREANAYYRMGSRTLDGLFVEGADEALAGGRRGTVVNARGRCPADDPRPALAGREFDVRIEVVEVKRFVPAALDEAFLKQHDFDDVDELRRDVRRRILRARERQRDRLAEERVVDRLVSALSFPLPEDLVAAEVAAVTAHHRERAAEQGVPETEAEAALAGGAQAIHAGAEARLRASFLLDRIAEAEAVAVSEAELVAAVERLAQESGQSTADVVAHFQEDPGRLESLRRELRHTKVRELLRRSAVLVEEAAPPPSAS